MFPDHRPPESQSPDDQTRQSVPFYEGRKQGWYWYEKEPEKAEKPKEKPKVAKHVLPSLKDYTMKQLWNMYPDDFQALLNSFMKKAVQNPTEENVMEYLTMQDIARRKALAYASVQSYVIQTHPELSNKVLYPVTTPGRAARTRLIRQEQEQTIRSARQDFALIMFSREGCEYCKAQAAILNYFMNKYQWPVRQLDIEDNPYMAARFNVRITPSIILVQRKSGKAMPVSAGVISLTELEVKLYRTIRYLKGEITPEQWFMHDFERGTVNDVKSNTIEQILAQDMAHSPGGTPVGESGPGVGR